MRVLLYNFLQPEEPGAGGVGVYLANLVRALTAAGHQVITLSSGDRYALLRRKPRVTFEHRGHDRAVVINSPVVAPAAESFRDPQAYTDSRELDFLPALLRKRYGAIDVLHFQNIEGLTHSFFHVLRQEFPDARIVFSAHNYHTLCSRVTLWYQDRVVCEDYRDGLACTMCHAPAPDVRRVKARHRLLGAAKSHPSVTRPLLHVWRALRTVRRRAKPVAASVGENAAIDLPPTMAPAFAAFRESNLDLCREVFDHVLAVSRRTGDIMIAKGAPAAKVGVSYIGTSHHAKSLERRKVTDVGDGLSIGYIGYMTVEKGFIFFLECLERIPEEVARTIRVTVAARKTDEGRYQRLQHLAPRFREMRYFDGYTHDNLDEVLAGVNLGVVPVLWEDNLPQTAIELVSRGVPILTSDRGGAREIAGNPAFTFTAGIHDEFVTRICRLANRDLPLAEFWDGTKRLFSMDAHLTDLMRYYRSASPLVTAG